jgi:tetratricopeptide (TPR) repeat protein
LILAPRRTSVRSQRPEFRWREVAGAERYTISVSGDEGEVWRGESAGTAITPPDDAVLLTRGSSYLAELTAYGNQGRLRAEETVFSIMSEAETRQVGDHLDRIEKAAKDSTPGAAEYLTGSYLVGQGLYAEAIPYFESLCRLDPESPGAHEALANAYRAIGLADLAATEFQKALELTRSPAGAP